MSQPLIALLTDFGTSDHYVGVMKGVMKNICPEASFIDITHGVTPQDVRAGAFLLMNAYKFFPKGTIFLAIVDPGVGTARRAVVVQAGDYLFVAPDNGLLSYVLHHEPVHKAAEYDAKDHAMLSYTFHGRDVFAPLAASLALTGGIQETTPRLDPAALVRLPLPIPTIQQRSSQLMVRGEVLYIDHFGNAITNIGEAYWQGEQVRLNVLTEEALPVMLQTKIARVKVGNVTLQGIHQTYSKVKAGEPLILVGSTRYLEVAVNSGNAAQHFGLKAGDDVTVMVPVEAN